MKRQVIGTGALVLGAAVGAGFVGAGVMQPEMPEGMAEMMPPPPGEHHKWLEQLVGEWTVSMVMNAEGMAEMRCQGTDSVKSLGGRWVVAELESEAPGLGTMNAIMSLGYNPETGKYQGTWIDSMSDHMWVYVGTLDASKKMLTLEAEGPNMMDPEAGMMKYRDVIEFKSNNHRTLTSSAYQDGQWVQFVKADYRRVK